MSNKNTILLTGGTGKISRRLAPYLSSAGHNVIMASRSGTCPLLLNCQGIAFNWLDSSTYNNLDLPSVSAIFLIAPPIMDPFPPMKEFIDLSILKGVKRLVIISGSLVDVGDGPMMARVSKYITSLGVEYAVLRPSWFMENFLEPPHMVSIRDESTFSTASRNGKIPFIACDDIAAVAFHALTSKRSLNADVLLLGPELLSYDDVAILLSTDLNRNISHTHISEDELAQSMVEGGIEPEYARVLARLDTAVANHEEERMNNAVEYMIGRPPINMKRFMEVEAEKGVWNSEENV